MSIEAIIQAAMANLSRGRSDEAMAILDRALRDAPEHKQLLQLKAGAAWQAGDLYAADDALRALIAANQGDTPATDLMSAQLALDLLEFDRARAAIDRLLKHQAAEPAVAITAVRLLVWQGETPLALDLLDTTLSATLDHPGLLALAVAHDRALPDERLRRAETLASALPSDSPDKTGLLYPLARYHDRIGAYDRAWALMVEANLLSAARMSNRFDALACAALKTGLIDRATRALSQASALAPAPDIPGERHVYLVGAPRTGSSLLQSVLAAHAGVQSAGERGALLPYLNDLCDQPEASPPPDFLTRIQEADRSGLARAGLTASVLIDKTTHNLFIAPLIGAIHPRARFVNVMRRPHDVALSMLLHDFPPAFPEACDLGAIIAMLEARAEVSALFVAQGFAMMPLDFDAFTAAPETQGESLAEAIGLDWQAETLKPENREAAVATFSAGQVRQPITPTPGDKWQRFAPFIPALQQDQLAVLDRIQTARVDAAGAPA